MIPIFIQKRPWILGIILLVLVNIIASYVHFGIDLTQERRYTIAAPTKKVLRSLTSTVQVTVMLEGDMPAGFKNLRNRTAELLERFQNYSGTKLQYQFQKPAQDSSEGFTSDALIRMGLQPTNVKVKVTKGEAEEQRYLFPGAIIQYHGKTIPIDFLEGQDMRGGLQSINKAEALLEYKFISAIQSITTDTLPLIGYLIGNGEPLNYNVYHLIEGVLKPRYRFAFLPIDSVPVIPKAFDAIIVVKPEKPFSETQKLKLDQYVMYGGKMFWMIDRLYAEMDSLMRKQADFVAFERGLNLDDLFFKYGVRINPDLVQDLQCDQMPMVVGSMGDQPQMQLTPWPYFPLLNPSPQHPISKNLNTVLSIFPNSIDTVQQKGIWKTILLTTSDHARVLRTPAVVSLNSVKTEDDIAQFNRAAIPIAVLLEGSFQSLYRHRLAQSTLDSLSNLFQQPYREQSPDKTKVLIVSDADLVTNIVTQQEGPQEMGMNQFTKTHYANKDFLLNGIEYLVNPTGVLETRSKEIALRLFDPQKMEEQRNIWVVFNLAAPLVVLGILGGVFYVIRKKRYSITKKFRNQ